MILYVRLKDKFVKSVHSSLSIYTVKQVLHIVIISPFQNGQTTMGWRTKSLFQNTLQCLFEAIKGLQQINLANQVFIFHSFNVTTFTTKAYG